MTLGPSGSGIVRGALDAGAFDTFVFPDGMVSESLVTRFGSELETSFGQNPSSEGPGRDAFVALATANGFDGTTAFAAESYDSAALILLARDAVRALLGELRGTTAALAALAEQRIRLVEKQGGKSGLFRAAEDE